MREKSRIQLGVKRCVDVLGVLLIFAIVCLPYLVVALCILISMGRPVHYWQMRIGKSGRPFRFYKFRSMVKNSAVTLDEYLEKNEFARQEWREFQKLKNDPRITPFGRFIRRFGIDEFPQLLNVLRGDMSLVGPRPCMERQRTLYANGWSHYCAMRPGMTGLWQVSGRNLLPYSKRVELDVNYVTNWSLWLDLKILLRTFRVVLRGDGC
ncbi:sugar transferase [Variovorax dokdonensis]|uniref:sugar transferase n=1 Tax=Variovorax dokdonensis TaxID=344883 RepID=UPI002646910A|nr:sugar transferase [Variovorax dokdonensis]